MKPRIHSRFGISSNGAVPASVPKFRATESSAGVGEARSVLSDETDDDDGRYFAEQGKRDRVRLEGRS